MLLQQVCSESLDCLFYCPNDRAPAVQWFDYLYWQNQDTIVGSAQGRGTTYFIEYQSQQWVLRHYCRGGLIAKLFFDQYLYLGKQKSRAYAELKLLAQMQLLGLPAPTPVAAKIRRHGLFYRADIICERIANARDVHSHLMEQPLSDEIWQRIGATVAMFHREQVYHHDLNIHNIMLDSEQKIWLIDFDRCCIKTGQRWKQSNLDRLLRSLQKESKRCSHYHFSLQHWQQFMRGYQAGV